MPNTDKDQIEKVDDDGDMEIVDSKRRKIEDDEFSGKDRKKSEPELDIMGPTAERLGLC